ncbi:hypothetical protein TNCV_4554261 [Trichonephila clavipes]|nr:hypothetical protein TNCV_4554261 [Trichonephila clavipes]
MLPNSTDNYRGMIVGSMKMIHQHRTWGHKLRLVCKNRGNSRREESEPLAVLVECVTPTKMMHDAESLLFGRRRDYYSTIGPSILHVGDFEASGWWENCAGHLTIG